MVLHKVGSVTAVISCRWDCSYSLKSTMMNLPYMTHETYPSQLEHCKFYEGSLMISSLLAQRASAWTGLEGDSLD
jgi:hypothetical protein